MRRCRNLPVRIWMANKMEEHVIVIGAGGHAKVVISTLLASGIKIDKIFDDNPEKWGSRVFDIEVTGPLSNINSDRTTPAITAIGDNKTRKDVVRRFARLQWKTVVHPTAYVHPTVHLGKGTVVFAKAVIQPDTKIGDHCIINTGSTIDHDCLIGNYVHISPGTNLAGEVQLGDGAFCGIGSKVINGIRIGKWATIGAGGVVIHDLPEDSLAVGVPARVIDCRENNQD
jgi:sugar O-acyltransferase (sialic acid O-acetyltransferase NeuD family)